MKNVFKQTIDDVHGGKDWSKAEQLLLDDCEDGKGVSLPETSYNNRPFPPPLFRPSDAKAPELHYTHHYYDHLFETDRHVRAKLIRYLLLGGCKKGSRPHPKGILLANATIVGDLDFEGRSSKLELALVDCFFPNSLNFRNAELGALFLSGSKLTKGARLQGIKIKADLHVARGFESAAMIDLIGASIGGQFSCSGARFEVAGGPAFNCGSAEIGADVFLDEGFRANGLVDFRGSMIGGQFNCLGGRFENHTGDALILESAKKMMCFCMANKENTVGVLWRRAALI